MGSCYYEYIETRPYEVRLKNGHVVHLPAGKRTKRNKR